MRVFLRLLNGRRITLWLQSDATFSSLQILVDQSKQCPFPSHTLEFVCGSRRVTDRDIALSEYAHIDDPSRIHMFVRPKLTSAFVREDYCTYHVPANGAAKCAVCGIKLLVVFESTAYRLIDLYLLSSDSDISNLLSIRDEKDDAVRISGFRTDAGACSLTIELDEVLNASTKYTVYIDLSKLPSGSESGVDSSIVEDVVYGYYEWSFTTGKLPTIRILATLVDVTNNSSTPIEVKQLLLPLSRQTGAMLEEVLQQLAAAFCIPRFSIRQVLIHRLLEGISVAMNNNREVAGLNESDSLQIEYDASLSDPSTLPVATKVFTGEDWKRYNEVNWVNEESGYLAVCGKMTEEEERDLLLQVVQAFATMDNETLAENDLEGVSIQLADAQIVGSDKKHQQSIQEVSANANESSITTTDAISTVMSQDQCSVPVSMRSSYWNHPTIRAHVFPLDVLQQSKECQQDLVLTLKQRGYALLQLGEATGSVLTRTYQVCEEFFAQSAATKERCVSTNHYYLGYRSVPMFSKEFFQLRRYDDQADINTVNDLWPSYPADFKLTFEECYTHMHDISCSITSTILHQLGCDESYIQSLLEPSVNDTSFGRGLSRCNISAFHYSFPEQHNAAIEGSSGEDVFTHCPHHSDLTFVTVIPIAHGAAGLHLYDWVEEQWMDMETNAPFGHYAVVFCGELMNCLTGGYLMPAMHEVSRATNSCSSSTGADRYSLPFQCCGRDNAVLDPSRCTLISSSGTEELASAVNLGLFMDSMSTARVSSNFLKSR